MSERKLWQAVIETAVNDTFYSGEKKDFLIDARRADHWLRSNSTDFQHVCELAGMDPDFIRESYMKGRLANFRKVNKGKQNEKF